MVAIKENQKNIPQRKPRKISWETFQKKYLSKEDKYKYEWLDGIVEKTPRTMNHAQFFIQDNLVKFLAVLYVKHGIDGQLIVEGDTFFKAHHRRPDLAYYTRKQILAAKSDKNIVPQFVIEVISSTDQINRVNQKVIDYRNAGVEIIWHIFPDFKEVHIYTDDALKIEVKRNQDICSAEPVIKGFNISVANIFKE